MTTDLSERLLSLLLLALCRSRPRSLKMNEHTMKILTQDQKYNRYTHVLTYLLLINHNNNNTFLNLVLLENDLNYKNNQSEPGGVLTQCQSLTKGVRDTQIITDYLSHVLSEYNDSFHKYDKKLFLKVTYCSFKGVLWCLLEQVDMLQCPTNSLL